MNMFGSLLELALGEGPFTPDVVVPVEEPKPSKRRPKRHRPTWLAQQANAAAKARREAPPEPIPEIPTIPTLEELPPTPPTKVISALRLDLDPPLPPAPTLPVIVPVLAPKDPSPAQLQAIKARVRRVLSPAANSNTPVEVWSSGADIVDLNREDGFELPVEVTEAVRFETEDEDDLELLLAAVG